MSDQIFEQNQNQQVNPEQPIETKPVKKPRKKRTLTEEQKKINIENLRKGRQTALENRRKKAILKKIEKEKLQKQNDQKVEEYKNRVNQPKEIQQVQQPKIEQPKIEQPKKVEYKQSNDFDLTSEIKQLKAELKEMRNLHQRERDQREINDLRKQIKELQGLKSEKKPVRQSILFQPKQPIQQKQEIKQQVQQPKVEIKEQPKLKHVSTFGMMDNSWGF